MPLDVATTICVRDRKSNGPASLVDIAEIVGAWAELESPESAVDPGEWSSVGSKGSRVRTERLDPGAGSDWAWRLHLSHHDLDDPTILWEVDVEAAEPEEDSDGETYVSVTLARTSTDDRVRHVRTDHPAPPRVIRELVDAPTLECMDGPIPIAVAHSALGRLAVPGFVQETLLNPERRLPAIGISVLASTGKPVIDPERLARALAGMAHVWLIPPDVTWSLESELPERLGVYNGAVRIWWPGLGATSDPYDHHLYLPEASDPERRVVAVVTRSALARFRPLEAIARLQRRQREIDRQRAAEELTRLRERLATTQTVDAGEDDLSALKKRLDYAAEVEQEYQAEVTDLETKVAELQVARDNDFNRISALKAQVEGLRRASPAARETEPAADAFIAEIHASYEARYTDSDKSEWKLGPIELHPDFLASVDALTGVSREKIVEVCVDVACERVHTIPARETHVLRVGPKPNDPPRVRARDGAGAWRCYLQHKTPQARRLHWWSLRDGGGVELAHVGMHDDLRCPE